MSTVRDFTSARKLDITRTRILPSPEIVESSAESTYESLARKETGSRLAVFLLTAREASKMLRISERTLWELKKQGKIRHVQIGRSVRYDPRDLQAWIENQKSGENDG
jgi:excisionase family DNA binding protein